MQYVIRIITVQWESRCHSQLVERQAMFFYGSLNVITQPQSFAPCCNVIRAQVHKDKGTPDPDIYEVYGCVVRAQT